MQGNLNHLSPEYIDVKREVKTGIIIMIEEDRRTEIDHIVAVGLVGKHSWDRL